VLAHALVHRAISADEINARDVQALQAQLLSRTPIAFTMRVYRSWYTSARTRLDGQITLPLPYDAVTGLHAITLVGFGIDADLPGGGYFIFDNSWGTSWAPNNRFRAGSGILPFKYVQLYGDQAWVLKLEGPRNGA
jgi:C1A family cysteine protease